MGVRGRRRPQDGAEAWRLFEAGDFPIVITDWMMPEVDGLELIRRIRAAQRPGYVYAILLTARSQKEDLVEGMEAGADDFLTKPFDRDELRVRLRAAERIIGLEQSLAEQNRALRETQAALVQTREAGEPRPAGGGRGPRDQQPDRLRHQQPGRPPPRHAGRPGACSTPTGRAATEPAAEAARLEEEVDLAYLRETFARTVRQDAGGAAAGPRHRPQPARLRPARRGRVQGGGPERRPRSPPSRSSATSSSRRRSGWRPASSRCRRCLCHPGKVNQVFLNLLVNAIQACRAAAGSSTVRTRPDGEAASWSRSQDNGCGIRPEHRPQLFEPFFTTKPVGQGTGLGLSVSFGIVRDHGGAIEVESEVGRGSTFRVRLPPRTQRSEVRRSEAGS